MPCCATASALTASTIGWTASEGEDRIQREFHGGNPDCLAEAAAKQPLGRLVDAQEVARAMAFLSSGESGLTTGAMVNYDQSVWGGFNAPPHPAAPL